MGSFTQKQWITLVIFSLGQFCSALCFSIQAPFFPAEAEKKGATPSQYGFVFGVYQLVIFITCPIYGRFINSIGVKLVNITAIFTLSITSILFGFIIKINGATTFIAFAFVIRILEGTGAAAFSTSVYSIIGKEFPDNLGTAFAILETFLGLGLIIGPSIGGLLYELGGFLLPFITVGCFLLFTTLLIIFILPSQDDKTILPRSKENVFIFLIKPPILISYLTAVGCSFSVGFVEATLEPHIRILGLTPSQVGLVFILNGGAYSLSAPLWGRILDKYLTPLSVCCAGTLLVLLAFLLIGPAPFLPLDIKLHFVIIALVFHGLGMGADLVASFVAFYKYALLLGLPSNITTYSLISGLHKSAFALGAFIGPSVAGVLFDYVGFRWGSQTVVLLHAILFIVTIWYLYSSGDKLKLDFVTNSTIALDKAESIVIMDSKIEDSYGSSKLTSEK